MNTQTLELPASALATHASSALSDRYGFIPTTEIIEAFGRDGWQLTNAKETKVRKPCRQGLQRHLLRFAHESQLQVSQGERIEMLLINSHDGTSSVQLAAGVYRFACANGLVVADSTVASIRLGHHKLSMNTVLGASHKILGQAEKVTEVIHQWKNTPLSEEDAFHLAEQGIKLRWPDETLAPISPLVALSPSREADVGLDLWRVFNRVQSSLIQGGQRDGGRKTAFGKQFRATKGIKALDANVRINSQLWELATTLTK
jgi:hypothetical protein